MCVKMLEILIELHSFLSKCVFKEVMLVGMLYCQKALISLHIMKHNTLQPSGTYVSEIVWTLLCQNAMHVL